MADERKPLAYDSGIEGAAPSSPHAELDPNEQPELQEADSSADEAIDGSNPLESKEDHASEAQNEANDSDLGISPQRDSDEPEARKTKRSLMLKVIAAGVVIAAAAFLWSVAFPTAARLDRTSTVDGLSINHPAEWRFEESVYGLSFKNEDDGLTSIYILSVPVDTSLVGETGSQAFETLIKGLRLDSDSDYGIEETEISGCPAVRYEYTQNKDGADTLYRGVAVLTGARRTMVKTQVPISSKKDALTIGEILDSVTVDVPKHEVTFFDEQGEEFGKTLACDHGSGAYAVLPDVVEDGDLLASNWALTEGIGDIATNENGETLIVDVKTDVKLTAKLSKYWTVTFTDGQGEILEEVKIPEGMAATAPTTPTREGYNFVGWDADFSSVTQDLTVNAQWKEKPKTYTAGSYRVGTDIPAGEYKITCTGSHAYYCVYPDSSKSEILSNGNFTTCTYIGVSDGQLLEVKGSSFVSADAATPSETFSGEGIYKVGFDIQPGEYNISCTDSSGGYYAVLSTVDANTRFNIVNNDNFEGNSYVTVQAGQYLEISRASIDVG